MNTYSTFANTKFDFDPCQTITNLKQESPQLSEEETLILPYDLVPSNHTLLFTKLEPFDFDNPPIDPIELANRLIVTMNKHNGVGLSANQCGLPYRVFVMRSNPTLVCFNPKIIDSVSAEISLEEGCLSHPFLYVPIKRPSMVKVRFTDAFGVTKTEKFIGLTARCFQHEFDHLEGINYLNRANPIHVDRAKRARDKIAKRLKPVKK